MADGDIVILRDVSSGRFHRGTRFAGRIQTFEECNLDDAGDREELAQLPPDPPAALLCDNCFTEPS